MDPKTKLEERFTELYALTPEEQTRENDEKHFYVQRWLAVCDDPINVPVQKVFTPKQMSERIRKLRPGKGSPDGYAAELFHGLPNAAACSLAIFFTCVLLTLQIPHMWTQGQATLIPKIVAPGTIESGQIWRDSLSDGCSEIAGVPNLGDTPRLGLLLCPMWFCTSSPSSRTSVQNQTNLRSVQGM